MRKKIVKRLFMIMNFRTPVARLGALRPRVFIVWFIMFVVLFILSSVNAATFATLRSKTSEEGYLARLLINESPFPGEHGWQSERNTKATMLAILWVLHSRLHYIPDGYSQAQIASVKTSDIIDIITVGGEKGQCDGFYRDASGHFTAVPRVEKRINYLLRIANSGNGPGKFARLINYAQKLGAIYIKDGITGVDRFAKLTKVEKYYVTGRAYSWMTDKDYYSPGGNFIKIPNNDSGSLGGNRFFTLKKVK
jgi:hypothetical protein